MTGAACRAGNAYNSGAPDFTSGFHRGSCCPVIYVSLFPVIVLSFVFWVLIVPFVWLLGIYIFCTSNDVDNDNALINPDAKSMIYFGFEQLHKYFASGMYVSFSVKVFVEQQL